MSRFINILVPKKRLAAKDYEAIKAFVVSNPAFWDKGTLEALDNDWKSGEREHLFLSVRVGTNQGYEDVPYLNLSLTVFKCLFPRRF